MRLKTVAACALAFILLSLPTAFAQVTANTDAARAFVDNVASQGLDTIKQARSGKLSNEQAKINFRKILNDAFDVPTIAKFTLGKYWRVATPEQQAEYTRLLRTGILDKYADRVLSYAGNDYKITQASAINDTDYNVDTVIDRGNEPAVDFTWRLRKSNEGIHIIDLSVEGISMSVTHRSDFASVIERDGGRVEGLLAALRNKEITQGE